MTTPELLFENIRSIDNPPTEETFKEIEDAKHEMIDELLAEVVAFADNPNVINQQSKAYIRHVVSIFLLAYFRHSDAYLAVIKLISHRGDKVIKLTGEVFTEALGRILASLYNGDLQPIKSVVENPHLSTWIRAGALDSLMVLWTEDVLSRDEVVDYLRELMEGKIEAKPSYLWDTIALIAYDLHPRELRDLLLDAITKKLIEPMVLDENSLAICLKADINSVIGNKGNVVEGFIKSPIQELTWWLYPDTEALDKGMEYAALAVPITDKKTIPGERGAPIGWRVDTTVRGKTKIGRNDPCFCGSGVKYKKCCGAAI